MSISFRCNGPGGIDMCFNGGQCVNASASEHVLCECPPGFERDYILFHNDNCVLPSNFLLGLFTETSVLALIALLAMLKAAKNHPKTLSRDFALQQCVQIILCWLVNLSYFLQRGYFEGVAVFGAMATSLAAFQIHYAFKRSVLRPLLAADLNLSREEKHVILRAFGSVYTLNGVRSIVMNIILISICRNPDPSLFNIVLVANTVLEPISAITNYFLLRPHHRKLRDLIDKSLETSNNMNTESLDALREYRIRISKTVGSIYTSIAFYMSLFIPACISYLVLGSCPYSFVIYIVMTHTTFLMALHIYRLAPRHGQKKSSTQDPTASNSTPKKPVNDQRQAIAAYQQAGLARSQVSAG